MDKRIFEQGQTLWSVLDTAIDGIIIINERGIIQIVNQAVEKMFDYHAQEIISKNISMLMPSPDHERHDSYLSNHIRTGEAKIIGIGREVTALAKSGKTFPIRLAVSEVFINDNRYFTGILHDLSAQKHAEEQLLNLTYELENKVQLRTEELGEVVNKLLSVNKQLQTEIAERIEIERELKINEEKMQILLDREKELNQMKSRFVSMASHEFRTPLSTILSSAALIDKYVLEGQQDKRSKHVYKIKNAVTNLTNILNDFLSLEKLEEGLVGTKMEVIHVNSFCQELVEEMNSILKQGQRIELICLDNEMEIVSDTRCLYNSMINLMSNAIKYSDEDQVIRFEIQLQEDIIEFKIKDDGIGIPADEQSKLFTRFYRARNATNIQGTGLGLHIVSRYMDLIGGNVRFKSDEGVGSEFTLEIPL
jgi:two-component system sensor kinase FixL